jgi:hypothetical protein
MSEIEDALRNAAERSIMKIISDGSWIAPDYNNRVKLPADFMADVWKLVDREKVKRALADRIEEQLAERIVNAIAAELATDIKQILSVTERREAIRALAREHMQAIMAAGAKA